MAEKTEKKSGGGQIIKLALVLFAVSAIMALALGLVYEMTKDTIAMRAAETTKNAYANVLAADEYTEQADFENDGTITKLSTATAGGQQAGYVAETTFSGAQGMITMVVGLDSDYNCTGVYVTKLRDLRPRRQGGGHECGRLARQPRRPGRRPCPDEGQGHRRGHLRRDDHVPRRRHRSADRHQRGQVAGLRRAET